MSLLQKELGGDNNYTARASCVKESKRKSILDDVLLTARMSVRRFAIIHRRKTLIRVVDLAPKSYLTSLRLEIQSMRGDYQVEPILKIVDRLPKKSRPATLLRTLQAACNYQGFETEYSTQELAIKLAENGCFKEALQTVAVIEGTYGFDDEHKTRTLLGLLKYLPKLYLKKAIELVQSFEKPIDQARALVEFIPYTGLDMHPAIVNQVSQILRIVSPEYLLERTNVLVKLARYDSDSFFAGGWDLFNCLLEEIRQIDNYRTQVRGLLNLATIADESDRLSLVLEAWKAAQRIEDIKTRAYAILELLSELPESIRREALGQVLDSVLELPKHSDQGVILLSIFEQVRESDDVAIMSAIFDHLEELDPAELSYPLNGIIKATQSWEGTLYLHRVKNLAKKIPDYHERAKVFLNLISALSIEESVDILASALEAAIQIDKWWERRSLLSELSEHLIKFDPRILFSPWCNAMTKLASQTREDLLLDLAALAPVISALGGEHACKETYNAISDVARWWL